MHLAIRLLDALTAENNTENPGSVVYPESYKVKLQLSDKWHWGSCCSTKGRPILTSTGTRRFLPRCWLKERHQASVYPFMLGTYFFTVSSFSLSHTPSSLWIYGKQATEPCLSVTAVTGQCVIL